MDEEALIVCVQEYPNLYDLSNPKYHDKNVKFNSWQEIGVPTNQPAEQCKSKWKSLRECYRKAVLKRETKSGQSSKKLKPWRLEQQMEFVKPYVNVQREQESNISDGELVLTDSLQDPDNPEVTENTPSVARSASTAAKSTSTSTASASTAHGSASSAPGSASNGGTVNEEVSKRPSRRMSGVAWKKPKTMTPTAAVFQEYVNFKKQQSGQKSIEVTPADHLTKYFQGVEETVRILPPELQVRVKSKISRIVHDAELEAISVPRNIGHSIPRENASLPSPSHFQTNHYISQKLSAPIHRIDYQRTQERQPGGSSSYPFVSSSGVSVPNDAMSPENVYENTLLAL